MLNPLPRELSMAIKRARIAFSPGASRNSGRHGVGQRFGYSLVDFRRIPQIYGIAHMRFHARAGDLQLVDLRPHLDLGLRRRQREPYLYMAGCYMKYRGTKHGVGRLG
jgi:hypothetical protein